MTESVIAAVALLLLIGLGMWINARELKKRQPRRDVVIGMDQFTEQRRLQHANVGHKAAKGFQGKH